MPRFDLSPYPYLGDMGQNPPVTLEDGSSQDVIGYVVFITIYGCFQKRGIYPKMDGENNGTPY